MPGRVFFSAALALCLACGAPRNEPARPETGEIPAPDLSSMEPAVARQLRERREALDAQLSGGEISEPRLVEELGEMGRLYHAYDLLEPARFCYEHARLLAPGEFRWAYLLGYLHQTAGDLERAARHLEAAVELRPRDVPALVRLAAVRMRQDRGDLAQRLFRRALEVDPTCAVAHRGLGQIDLRAGTPGAAVEHLERALELQPRASSLHSLLATAYRKRGDPEKAREHQERFGATPLELADPLVEGLQAESTGVAVEIARGNAALRDRRLEQAAEAFRRAVDFDPESAVAREHLASTLLELGDLEAATAHLEAAVRLAPENAKLYFLLGRAWARRGDDQRALERYRAAASLAPGFVDARFNQASALARLGRFEESLEVYGRVLELDPQDVAARSRRATLLQALGRGREAEAELRRAIADYPADPQLRRQLAALLQDLGEPE